MIRHQIGLQRFSGFVRNKIWRLLDATETDVRGAIATRLRRNLTGTLTPVNLRRMARLLKQLREIRGKAWDEVDALMALEMRELSVAEPKFQQAILDTIFPVKLGTSLPAPSLLRSIVNTQPFDGALLSEHLSTIRRADVRRIDQAVKIGMVQGESIPQISRRVVGTVSLRGRNGTTEITRRQAAALVRTAVSGIGSNAREQFAEENKDLAPEKFFVATLDSRTTPVCRKWDGSLHNLDTRKSVNGPTAGETTPVLPLHVSERSIFAPVVDGEVIGDRPIRNFTQKQLVREFGEQEGIKVKVPKGETLNAGRDAIPRGHKGAFDAFARKRMRELTGRVPAKVSYPQFLKRQSAEFQDDILGKARGRLFRRGGLTLDKFVDSAGNEIPLRDLVKFEKAAFIAAGIDPEKFAA